MTVITHQFPARCKPEDLWAVLNDLTAVASYNPSVVAARFVGDRRVGLGAMRECDLRPSGKVVERVTVWQDGRALGLEVVKSAWPMHPMSWVTEIVPDGPGARVMQRLEYKMKFGLFGSALNTLVLRRKLHAAVGDTLKGLIAQAETKG